jgi:DNA repair protein RecO (recombination protein O)
VNLDRSPAIVLATRPLGTQDADLLVVLLTPDHGKVRCAARNARKSRRRFAGGLPGGALGEATVHPAGRARGGPGRGLWRLESFRSVHDLSALGRDLDRFAYVAYLCELTDALVHEPEPDSRRFAALAEAITATLSTSTPAEPGILRRFELVLLDTLGLLPTLRHCCVCGTQVVRDDAPPRGPVDDDAVPFDGARGGVLCPAHAQLSQEVSVQVLRLAARLLESADPEAARRDLAAAPAEDRRALRDLAGAVIRTQLRRPLRSLEFLRQVGTRPGRGG